MQVIHVLRNEQQFAWPFGIEQSQRQMRRIGFNFVQLCPPRVVEFVHQRRIASICFWSANILNPVPFPQAIRPTERREAAFRADPGPGQDNDAAQAGPLIRRL